MALEPEFEWLFQVVLICSSGLPTVHLRNEIFGNLVPVNPFCVLSFSGDEVARSKICKGGNSNPTWTQTLEIRLDDGVASLTDAAIDVLIRHHDYKRAHHRDIGTARIPLADFVGDGGDWRQKTFQVDAAEGATAGETQATIRVSLQKKKVLKPANQTAEVPPTAPPPSEDRSAHHQITIAAASLGVQLAEALTF